jgi:hypothetical protein
MGGALAYGGPQAGYLRAWTERGGLLARCSASRPCCQITQLRHIRATRPLPLSYSALHNFLPDCSPKAGCWDEGEGGHYAKGEHCATNTSDVSCHIATLVISPSTKAGARSGTRFNHYSLLGTAEQLLHLSKLGQAASGPTMTKAFNL